MKDIDSKWTDEYIEDLIERSLSGSKDCLYRLIERAYEVGSLDGNKKHINID